MKLLYGHSDEVAAWVAWRIPYVARRMARDPTSPPFGPAQAIGVINDAGELVAGVVYHGYDPDCPSVEMSFAASTPKWLTKALIGELLRYVFVGLSCRRVTALTPRRATSARKFIDRFGFKREGCVRFGFGDDHAIVSGLLASEWAQSRFNPDRACPPAETARAA